MAKPVSSGMMPVTKYESASSSVGRNGTSLAFVGLMDCAAALGAATSDAVAARPAALVAVTCAALVLYWAAAPVAR